jgi:hypothetical protein
MFVAWTVCASLVAARPIPMPFDSNGRGTNKFAL